MSCNLTRKGTLISTTSVPKGMYVQPKTCASATITRKAVVEYMRNLSHKEILAIVYDVAPAGSDVSCKLWRTKEELAAQAAALKSGNVDDKPESQPAPAPTPAPHRDHLDDLLSQLNDD